jgi:hypothetical protein
MNRDQGAASTVDRQEVGVTQDRTRRGIDRSGELHAVAARLWQAFIRGDADAAIGRTSTMDGVTFLGSAENEYLDDPDRIRAVELSQSPIQESRPRVLLVYYTYTQQTKRVAAGMADVLRDRGCEVSLAEIEFTDERWADRFSRFPFRHAYFDVLGMLAAQLRGATGEIRIPEEARDGDYDLICVGSPTWFFRPSVPIRSFLTESASPPSWSAAATGTRT